MPAFLTPRNQRARLFDAGSRAPRSRARIVSAAAAPLSSCPRRCGRVRRRRVPVAPSIASDGFSTAWLLWHSTHPLSKICAWTLVANFVREHRVARAADVGDRADARRRRAMVAVAVVAGRRRQIVPLGQRGVVHALLVVGELTGRQRRCRRAACSRPCACASAWHARAGRGDVGREHRRLRVVDQADAVRRRGSWRRWRLWCRRAASRLPCTLVAYSAA